jgi:hypothetical protein
MLVLESRPLIFFHALIPKTVLLAWSKSSDPNRVEYAEVLLRRMIDLAKNDVLPNVAPDLVSYNIMLSTIARGKSQQQDVLEKAEYWMKVLLQTTKSNKVPTVVTYRALFQIIACSKIQDRATRAHYWLQQCTDEAVKRDAMLLKKIQDMDDGANIKR